MRKFVELLICPEPNYARRMVLPLVALRCRGQGTKKIRSFTLPYVPGAQTCLDLLQRRQYVWCRPAAPDRGGRRGAAVKDTAFAREG